MRRYERAHVNEVWCGDSSVGPYLKTEDPFFPEWKESAGTLL